MLVCFAIIYRCIKEVFWNLFCIMKNNTRINRHYGVKKVDIAIAETNASRCGPEVV